MTLFWYKLPLLCYGNCPWKILVSIRMTWFTQQSRKVCINTKSLSASLPSITVKWPIAIFHGWNFKISISPGKLRGIRDVFVATYKQAFWASDGNQKQGLFPSYVPWRHHICIAKSTSSPGRFSLATICPKIWTKPLLKNAKIPLAVPLKLLILTETSGDI